MSYLAMQDGNQCDCPKIIKNNNLNIYNVDEFDQLKTSY